MCVFGYFICLTLLISRILFQVMYLDFQQLQISSPLYFLFHPAWKEFAGFFYKIILITLPLFSSADKIIEEWGCLCLLLQGTFLLLGASVSLCSKMGIILAGFHKFLWDWIGMQINLSHFTPNKCLYLWQAENEGAGLYFSIKGQDDGCVCLL